MRTLLINSPVARMSPHARISPPLGVAYLAAHMRVAGHEVDVLDLNIAGLNLRRIDAAMARFKPELVGISAHTETYPNALRIASRLKEVAPSVPVVFGGSHPSIMPEDVLAEPCVDFVIVGEGEPGLAGLARILETSSGDFADVPGLCYSMDGEALKNPRAVPGDPDGYELPARDLFSLDYYADAFNVLTARGGCPYRCPFCSASFIWHGKHRYRSPKAVVDEVEMLIDRYGASFIFFVDDIFTFDSQWVGGFLHEMERVRGRLTWGCGTRVDCVDDAMLREMARLGCTGIQYGIESGAQTILDSNKGIQKRDAEAAVGWSVAAGIRTSVSFMVPFPEDTEQTLAETFDFIERLAAMGAEPLLSYTTPYPGTKFLLQADELGLNVRTDDWELYDCKHSIMDTKYLSADRVAEIVEARARDLGMQRSA